MASSSGDTHSDEIKVEEFEHTTNYVPPAQKSVNEILEADSQDESLKKYKETLLGGAAPGNVPLIEPDNPNNVLVKKLSVTIDGKPTHTVDLPASEEFTLQIKEGSVYKIELQFYVQRDIVTGLKYLHKVSRLGISVAKEAYMLGSYGPKGELYTYSTPQEEAPTGMMGRGKYRVRSLITDDDKNRWLEWTWCIDITKD
ncbi:rho guanine dissociation factor isoform 1 [Aphelenchoides avenae]|nr:rho guanine dissociation factor isoform 1 [Aphelenchus avenae]KAH7732284.1 rho guanine dissociation factor isoform 1 [Aphelenchus avenae]